MLEMSKWLLADLSTLDKVMCLMSTLLQETN